MSSAPRALLARVLGPCLLVGLLGASPGAPSVLVRRDLAAATYESVVDLRESRDGATLSAVRTRSRIAVSPLERARSARFASTALKTRLDGRVVYARDPSTPEGSGPGVSTNVYDDRGQPLACPEALRGRLSMGAIAMALEGGSFSDCAIAELALVTTLHDGAWPWSVAAGGEVPWPEGPLTAGMRFEVPLAHDEGASDSNRTITPLRCTVSIRDNRRPQVGLDCTATKTGTRDSMGVRYEAVLRVQTSVDPKNAFVGTFQGTVTTRFTSREGSWTETRSVKTVRRRTP